MVRIGTYVDREPVYSTVVYILVPGTKKRRPWCSLCCYYHIKVHDFSSIQFALDQLFVTNITWGVCFNNDFTTAL